MKVSNMIGLSRKRALFIALTLFLNLTARATMTNVNIEPLQFNPPAVKIGVNDQVKWTWVSNFHSSTSDDALWDSGVHNAGFVFTNTFISTGTYPYACVVHFFEGTVTVEAAGTGPTITNVNINPFSFDPPVVEINVNDSVMWTWVSDFHTSTSDTGLWDSGLHDTGFIFTNKFTSAGSFPYTCTVHSFGGTVTVKGSAGPPPVLTAPQFFAPSTFQFNYSATVGLTYVVSRSPDLTGWVPLATNVANASPFLFRDTNAPGASTFYQVFQLTNP